MHYIIKQEGKFHYIEEGEGETLILLHGLFGALSNWIDVINHFKGRYRIVIPLLPIYDLPLVTTNVSQITKYFRKFVEYKKYEDYTLIGNSLGGHVALVYCHDHPEKVKRLVLTASSGLYENAFGGSFPRREDRNFIRAKVQETFYDPNVASEELVDECFRILTDRMKLLKILSLAKSAIRHNMAKELKDIKIPTCLIWGKNDTITPPEVAEEFHKLLPNSELFWIDKCKHAPMMEHPQLFNTLLDEWLQKTPISGK